MLTGVDILIVLTGQNMSLLVGVHTYELGVSRNEASVSLHFVHDLVTSSPEEISGLL